MKKSIIIAGLLLMGVQAQVSAQTVSKITGVVKNVECKGRIGLGIVAIEQRVKNVIETHWLRVDSKKLCAPTVKNSPLFFAPTSVMADIGSRNTMFSDLIISTFLVDEEGYIVAMEGLQGSQQLVPVTEYYQDSTEMAHFGRGETTKWYFNGVLPGYVTARDQDNLVDQVGSFVNMTEKAIEE